MKGVEGTEGAIGLLRRKKIKGEYRGPAGIYNGHLKGQRKWM